MNKFLKVILFILYWIAQFTLGIVMTLPGMIGTLFCVLFFHGKVYKNGFTIVTTVSGNWGGVCLGAFTFCGDYKNSSYWTEITAHEFGHSIQNIYLSVLFPFLVGIPSMCRYWYQRILEEHYNKIFPADWYDRFWAESNATKVGLFIKKKLGQI